jgi:hypothetical protein
MVAAAVTAMVAAAVTAVTDRRVPTAAAVTLSECGTAAQQECRQADHHDI